MPRTYVRKRKVGYSSLELELGCSLVVNEGFSKSRAALLTNIPRTTLSRRLNKTTPTVRTVLSDGEEKSFLKEIRNLPFPDLTPLKHVLQYAYQFAKRLNIAVPDGWENKQAAGREWWYSVKRRQMHSYKYPEKQLKCPFCRLKFGTEESSFIQCQVCTKFNCSNCFDLLTCITCDKSARFG